MFTVIIELNILPKDISCKCNCKFGRSKCKANVNVDIVLEMLNI